MSAEAIRLLNDRLRSTAAGGRVVATSGVAAIPFEQQVALFHAVRTFDAFDNDNDPHREHDFGSVEVEGETYFWKISYYAPDMEHGSEDPSDPAQTVRVLTIMRADEY